ncbi:MAG: competence/damage-inducible protein A [Bacteroidota bacterium]|nr:competence/damage-inducible protein A [Bacteroidota bacterium]
MIGEIITIGDELLIGQVVNTNQAFIAEKLNGVGIYVEHMTTVGDNLSQILGAFATAMKRANVVCVTGGLGPTHDDITKQALCKFFDTGLVVHQQTLEKIKALFERRNLRLTQASMDQALVPRGCTVVENSIGSAPGMLFENYSTQEEKYLIAMPGVPFEMERIVVEHVVPFFQKKNFSSVVRHRTLKTTGISESLLSKKLGSIEEIIGSDGSTTLAFLPNPFGTKLRVTVRERSIEAAEQKLSHADAAIRSKAEKYIYSSSELEMEDVVGRLLRERKLSLATAESCTGGMIANRITNVSGSSEYFLRGYVAYSNASKVELLSVDKHLISQHGAVSREVAEAMAAGVRANAKSDLAISTTGIAGPTGGTPEKPVGLVWIGYSDHETTFAMKFNFEDNRLRFKERASQAALELLRRKLLGITIEK